MDIELIATELFPMSSALEYEKALLLRLAALFASAEPDPPPDAVKQKADQI